MANLTRDRKCTHDGKRCTCRWLLRWRDADGRSREKSFPHDKKTIANDWLKKVEGDAVQGVRAVTSTVKFGEFAQRCIAQRSGAESTKKRYASVLKHLDSLAGRKLVTVATDRAGVKTLLLETLPQKGVGQSQIELCHVLIVSTCSEAVREGEILSHSLSGIRLPSTEDETVDPTVIAAVTKEKVTELADCMVGEWSLSIWLARGCGLRRSEAFAVKLSDFSEDLSVLTIARQVISGTKTGPLKSRKPGETRSLPVPAYVAERVRQHVAEHGTTNGYLFTGKRSPFVSDSAFRVQWWKARAAAEMPELRYHDLRHCFASYLLGANIPVTDVSRWLGHRQIQITYDTYSHFIPKSFDRARDLLDAEWS